MNNMINIARSALFAHQSAAQVASQNVSNAQTEGYSRRRAVMADAGTVSTPGGRIGRGVLVQDVERVRDELLDRAYRRSNTQAEGYAQREKLVTRIESMFGEPSEIGMDATLDAFWSAWADLANQPASDITRKIVRQAGERVAVVMQDYSQRLRELKDATREELQAGVSEVNQIAAKLADLNRGLARGAEGGSPVDMLDQRDRLLDQLSSFGSVRVLDRGNGVTAVIFENAPLVDGSERQELRVDGDPPVLTAGTTKVSFRNGSGKLRETMEVLDSVIPRVQEGLDALARGLVEKVNEVHRSGYTLDDETGVDFFDPASVTASSIRISDALAADHTRVAASTEPGSASNNRLALAFTILREDSTAMGSTSFGGFYRQIVTEVALDVQGARHSSEVYAAVAEHASTQRESVSGVSTDEELVNLVQHQHAYQAASRLVSIADEMMQTLLGMV